MHITIKTEGDQIYGRYTYVRLTNHDTGEVIEYKDYESIGAKKIFNKIGVMIRKHFL